MAGPISDLTPDFTRETMIFFGDSPNYLWQPPLPPKKIELNTRRNGLIDKNPCKETTVSILTNSPCFGKIYPEMFQEWLNKISVLNTNKSAMKF